MKKCSNCGSIFVAWNWIFSPFWGTWKCNFFYNSSFPYFRWKFWSFFDRWAGECWDCKHITFSFFRVRNGIPKEQLEADFKYLPKHEMRDLIEEIHYLFNHGYKMWHKNQVKNRCHVALNRIAEMIDGLADNNKEKLGIDILCEDDIRNEEKQ